MDNKPRVHFIANGIYRDAIAGGDIHFFHMAEAVLRAGYRLSFFGGHALRKQLEQRFPAVDLALTDARQLPAFDAASFRGQLALFADYFRRLRGTLRQLHRIAQQDVVYAVSDYWFDVLPLLLCKARSKMMVLHMQAPSVSEIIARSRPDVDRARIASLHYWASQTFSVSAFRFCRNKRLLYVHPAMRARLLRKGYRPEELKYASFGVDPITPRPTSKTYDVVWIGRVHRQKGVDDLLATLRHLAARIPEFRAVLIGSLDELHRQIAASPLASHLKFAGFVSEEAKFQLFQESRLFLMPSRFEGSPRVIGEALVCNVPVVAYEVPTYRPLFGNFVRYVPCFDLEAFQREAEQQVAKMRAGSNYLDQLDLARFREENSWQTVERVFCDALSELQMGSALRRART